MSPGPNVMFVVDSIGVQFNLLKIVYYCDFIDCEV